MTTIEILSELRSNYNCFNEQEEPVYRALSEAIKAVSAQSERKKGKWIRENIVLTSNPPQYMWHCSECGKMVHWFTTEVLTDFCPNCGADMRGEQDAEH